MENERELRALALRFEQWLIDLVLPLWWRHGADHEHGGFQELLGLDGLPPPNLPRRARVQGRQSYVYAMAGSLGWSGPWQEAAPYGLDYLNRCYLRKDGFYRTLVSHDGTMLDDTVMLYDQAFALLAMASVFSAMPDRVDLKASAHHLYDCIVRSRRHSNGGFVESLGRPYQANPHMHLLEAALAWRDIEPGAVWDALVDEIVELCLVKFIDPAGGFLREFFDENWQPLQGSEGHSVEPGHQFEWCWLLERWSRLRADDHARAAARALYNAGLRGVDRERDAAIDELADDFTVRRATARLWPQTERVKAALIMAETAPGEARSRYFDEALRAATTLWRYCDTPKPGLWRDKLLPDGTFVQEPAPASSLYHIICCIASLKQALS
ncbi:MAG: AGE family epimerase/isomerase [Alphaproteobacteria bacterium]|nr:AGE family epimerase/isomerase [Alphaproteobacteria bacterium]